MATGERRLNQSILLSSLVLDRVVDLALAAVELVAAFVVVVLVAVVVDVAMLCFEDKAGVAFPFRRSSALRLAAATASLRDLGVFKSGVSDGGGGGGGGMAGTCSTVLVSDGVALSEARTDLASCRAV